GDDEVAVVREAQIGGPAGAAPGTGEVDRGDAGFPAPVLRLADVLEHLREAGRGRQRTRQQQIAGALAVEVERAADPIPEQTEVHAGVEFGGSLPHEVGIGDSTRAVAGGAGAAEVIAGAVQATPRLVRADGGVAGGAAAGAQLQPGDEAEAADERLLA